MAGISEAPIKLKVVGVTRLSRLPKRKPQKPPTKPSSKFRKPSKTSVTIISLKDNRISQNSNKTQIAPDFVPKVFSMDKYIKRRKMNTTVAKTKTPTSIKSTPEPPKNSTTVGLVTSTR